MMFHPLHLSLMWFLQVELLRRLKIVSSQPPADLSIPSMEDTSHIRNQRNISVLSWLMSKNVYPLSIPNLPNVNVTEVDNNCWYLYMNFLTNLNMILLWLWNVRWWNRFYTCKHNHVILISTTCSNNLEPLFSLYSTQNHV